MRPFGIIDLNSVAVEGAVEVYGGADQGQVRKLFVNACGKLPRAYPDASRWSRAISAISSLPSTVYMIMTSRSSIGR
jgi:hypothetical protein